MGRSKGSFYVLHTCRSPSEKAHGTVPRRDTELSVMVQSNSFPVRQCEEETRERFRKEHPKDPGTVERLVDAARYIDSWLPWHDWTTKAHSEVHSIHA